MSGVHLCLTLCWGLQQAASAAGIEAFLMSCCACMAQPAGVQLTSLDLVSPFIPVFAQPCRFGGSNASSQALLSPALPSAPCAPALLSANRSFFPHTLIFHGT